MSSRWLTAIGIVLATLFCLAGVDATAAEKQRKLTFDERVEIVRGLMAEFATSKVLLPRSKDPLRLDSEAQYDKEEWNEIRTKNGPAARVGDMVRITKVDLSDNELKLEINGGWKKGVKWYQRIEVGAGTSTRPISADPANPTFGTVVAIHFPDGVPPLKSIEFKKMLAPIFDFEQRSATEQYVANLPPEIKQAIEDKRVVEGMDKEQVMLAMGRPIRKVRETKDGEEVEDWIFGQPPGRIVFVTFGGEHKVIKVKEDYAGLGGSTVELDRRIP
jgi:hypothetical protein